jgi:hypothetical protein
MKNFKELHEINLSNTAATFLVYKFATLLKTPFNKWDAYKTDLIDKDGEILKKAETSKEKKSFSYMENFVLKIRKILLKYVRSEKLLSLLIYGILIKTESSGNIALVELREELSPEELEHLHNLLQSYYNKEINTK